jgi:hypothetical protein
MRHDGVSVTALMALAAFAVERLTSGLLYLLSLWKRWETAFPDPGEIPNPAESARARRHHRAAYFLIAGALVLIVVSFSPQIRILTALEMQAPAPLDIGLTCLVLVAGSDRIGDFLKGDGAGTERTSKPVEIVGRVQIMDKDEPLRDRAARSARAGD